MQPVIIRTSRGKALLLTLIGLGFVAAGILILSSDSGTGNRLVGWAGILFFGACSAVGVAQLLDSRPRLIIDEEGVFDRTWKIGKIPWSDILGARLQRIQREHFICLELADEERYLAKASSLQRALASANRALGFTAYSLNLSQVNADPHAVFELISRMIALQHSERQ